MKKIILLLGILNTLVVANEISLDKSTITSTTGFTENISKENKNVIIIGKEDISKKEYHNLEEVLNNTPNVMVQQTYFGPIVDLRGNGERAISRVKVLVDGIAINPIDDSMGTLPINTQYRTNRSYSWGRCCVKWIWNCWWCCQYHNKIN